MKIRRCCYCGCENREGDKELRPYGPNGADICFGCMMESPEREEEATRQFAMQLDACGDVAIIGTSVGPYPLKRGTE